jgi:tetratricopeptide (TPR) repeat protein
MAAARDAAPATPPPVGSEEKPPRTPEQDQPAAYFAALAEVKARFGMASEACELYRKAIERAKSDAERAEYQIGLAQALEAGGDKDAAKALWTEMSKGSDSVAAGRAQLQLASILAEQGQADKAAELLEKLALGSPIQLFRRTAADQLAKLLLSGKDWRARLAQYRERIRKEPGHRELLELVLALQADDPKGRCETLKEALAANPRDRDLFRRYPSALLDAGLLDEAEKEYRSLKENYPTESQLANDKLALIAARKGRPAEAEQMLLQSAANIPEGVQRSLYLARKYLGLGLWVPAEKHARQAYAQARGDAMKVATAIELGEALMRLGKREEALALLKPIAEQSLWRGLQVRAKGLISEMSGQKPLAAPDEPKRQP